MKPPRGLSDEEAALWQKVAATVRPLGKSSGASHPLPASPSRRSITIAQSRPAPPRGPRGAAPANTLDGSWDRKLGKAGIEPDFRLDLHGHTLDSAYRRLDDGLSQARAMGARLVLVVTGKERPVDPADRGRTRGAIRAKILDWLAAGDHSAAIAAVRNAHRKHGGEGALYLILRRDG